MYDSEVIKSSYKHFFVIIFTISTYNHRNFTLNIKFQSRYENNKENLRFILGRNDTNVVV